MVTLVEYILTTFYSFPDSLGDDLLVEVQDSKGKHFGRVLVQVAAIADNPVINIAFFSVELLMPVMSGHNYDRILVQSDSD